MSYKAVLFDMDGTLLDTLEDLRDSTNHVLRQMGYPERSLEGMRRNSGSVTFSGRCSATFVTRLRTERMPLVWIFVGSTRSASPTTERSESNMIVP